jgi:hypothetical protein
MWQWFRTLFGLRRPEPEPAEQTPELSWYIVGGDKKEPRRGHPGAAPTIGWQTQKMCNTEIV